MNIPQEIVTERLILKPISLEYAKEINEGLDKDVTRYMFPQPAPLSETISWIEDKLVKIQNQTDLTVVILDKETGDFIGGSGLHHIDTKTPETGIWIKKSTHGNHFGREAVAALKDWADKNLDYEYIVYPVDVANIPSRKIAEYLGGSIKDEYKHQNANGDDMNLVEYRIFQKKDDVR